MIGSALTGLISAIGTVLVGVGGVALKFLHEMKNDQMELGNHKATANAEMIGDAFEKAVKSQTDVLTGVIQTGNSAVITAIQNLKQ